MDLAPGMTGSPASVAHIWGRSSRKHYKRIIHSPPYNNKYAQTNRIASGQASSEMAQRDWSKNLVKSPKKVCSSSLSCKQDLSWSARDWARGVLQYSLFGILLKPLTWQLQIVRDRMRVGHLRFGGVNLVELKAISQELEDHVLWSQNGNGWL